MTSGPLVTGASPDPPRWRDLPRPAQIYVVFIVTAGAGLLALLFPRTWTDPTAFAALLCCSCVTSAWKVTLPVPRGSRATLSVSYAADLMALLLLGPRPAMIVAVAGAFTQCTVNVRRSEPWYRTVFSMAAEAVTMAATGLAYVWLGGRTVPFELAMLPRALVGAIATYFFVNTGLVAGAIAMSVRRSPWEIWRDGFLWSGPSFMVAGAAGAVAAVIVERGSVWIALLMFAPVYLTYLTYNVFLKRLEEETRHGEETTRLHQEAIAALLQARRAERALADEKERLAVTLRSIGDGVITTDLDGTILLINSVAETLTGWTQREAVGQPLGLVFRNFEPGTREPCDNSVAARTSSSVRLGSGRSTILVARDLTERPIEESSAPLCDQEGRTIGMVVAFRDITDSLRIQEERARAARIESLGLLAGGIAHDFNNILTSVMGSVSMARATLPHSPSINLLAEAEQACVRARQLTWQLLTFSKGGVPAKKTLSIRRILQESATMSLRGSTARCTFDLPPDLWTVEADEVQLVQVFSNVFINAQEAMPHGGAITVTAENVVEADRRSECALPVVPGNYLRVSILDEGIGIPKEHLGQIFDPYFSTKQRGSGLGLATTYSIVKNHGGFLVIESDLGRGTAVRVSIPASSNPSLYSPSEVAARPPGRRRRRVLVMDDDASVRTLASNMLRFLGYDAEAVDSGRAAIERFVHKKFDVVMLDLIVPGEMGGREAMQRLSGINPSVKAILLSGYAQNSAIDDFRHYGFQAVIAKPFTLQELSATLTSVMGSSGWSVH